MRNIDLLNYFASRKIRKAVREYQLSHSISGHQAALLLATEEHKQGKSLYALEILQNRVKKLGTRKTEAFELNHLASRIYVDMGDYENADLFLTQAAVNLPQKDNFHSLRQTVKYQQASLWAALRKTTQAQKLFDEGLPVTCGNGWITTTKLLDFGRMRAVRTSSPSPYIAKIIYENNFKKSNMRFVYFVSADSNYLSRFLPQLLEVMSEIQYANMHLHIHYIDSPRGNKSAVKINQLKSQLSESGISITISTKQILVERKFNEIQWKSIYSFERFRVLPDILMRYNLPVFVADIDQLPLKSPAPLLDTQFDVALLRYPKSALNILSVVSATLSIFRPTAEGLEAAGLLRSYFDESLKNIDRLNWHADQAGLAVLDYSNVRALIHYLDVGVVITDPTQYTPEEARKTDSFFWSYTYSAQS